MYRVLPERDRPRGFGVLFMGSSIGATVAGPLASWLYRLGGWRFAFVGTAGAGLLWLVPWLVLTQRRDVRAHLDDATAPATAPDPHRIRDLLRHPLLWRALLGIFAVAPIIGFHLIWGAKYLALTFHVDQGDVGDYLWLPLVAFDASALVFGDLAARRRRRSDTPPRTLVISGLGLALALAALPQAESPWQAMAVVSVALAGAAAVYTLVTGDLMARLPERAVPVAGGVLAGGQSLALIVSSPLIGTTIDREHEYVAVAIAVAVFAIPGTLAWLVWPPRAYGDRSTRSAAGSSSTR
jgi:predicted MFS family arabinose efflux permease